MPIRRQLIGPQATFSANLAVTYPIGGILPGTGRVRVLGVSVFCTAIPSDLNGTMLLTVQVRDVTEGAFDDLVTNQDLETLITAANTVFPCTLTPETLTEREYLLEERDTIRMTLTDNSVDIDTNAIVIVIVDLLFLDE